MFLSGFLIISLEIVWFRVLSLFMQSYAYAFSHVLGVFLIGDALGVLVGARVAGRVSVPRRLFFLLQGAVALYSIASIILIYLAHSWSQVGRWFIEGSGYYGIDSLILRHVTRLAAYTALVVITVLPPAFLLGMSFPVTQKAVQDSPDVVAQRVGIIQLFNILGNTAGAVITGLVLLQWLGTSGTIRLLTLIGVLFVVALLRDARHAQSDAARSYMSAVRSPLYAIFLVLLVFMIAMFPANTAFWSTLHGVTPRAGAIVAEDRTGVAVVTPDVGSHRLYIGGHVQSNVPFLPIHGALGLIGPLVHLHPRSILVIGHGSGGTVYASGVNPITQQIRVVEIVEPVLSVMGQFASVVDSEPVKALFADARIERIVADGRHVLFTDPRRYDVIQADAILPRSSHSGLLYSVEFFRQVRARLNNGGICVQWAPTARTVSTFLKVFPYAVQVNSVLIGSDRPIPFDIETLGDRLRGAARSYIRGGGWEPENLIAWFSAKPARRWVPSGQRDTDNDVNTDLFTKDEYYLNRPRIWSPAPGFWWTPRWRR